MISRVLAFFLACCGLAFAAVPVPDTTAVTANRTTGEISGPKTPAELRAANGIAPRAGGFNEQTVAAAGTTTLSIASDKNLHVEVLNVTGSAGTYTVVLPVTSRLAGDLVIIRCNLPATASLVVDLRNATAGGTQLLTLTTDTSGDDLVFIAYFNGTAFVRLFSVAT